jgi:lysyl-tRNA synthetase class 2
MTLRSVLELRAGVRRSLRDFFDARGFLEVDTPVLGAEVLPEAHIEPVEVRLAGGQVRWLQASPELLMKRLLAAGAGAIYQFAHAFRDGERGPLHDIEFELLEWYAPGATVDDAAELLERLCATLLGTRGLDRVDCGDAFGAWAGVDPCAATSEEWLAATCRAGVVLPEGLSSLSPAEIRDRCFEILLAEVVQPKLGHDQPTLLEAWPVSQAAFARVDPARPSTARRFELFVRGVELANGWEEETGREAVAARITDANFIRSADGRTGLPCPERFLEAHGPGMPAGVGVALGFDRLVMLAAVATSIDQIRPFSDGGKA